jgi:TAG lipase / steryl ester hydrolase / phospholipase A2 / LPA acyltransferase
MIRIRILTFHSVASCSVPFIFPATHLLAKDPKTGGEVPWNPSPQRWIDGSVDNDLPMTRLAEMFNVNHFIVSQVNPHVVPFLAKEEKSIATQAKDSDFAFAAGPSWLTNMATLAKDEALHRLQVVAELGIFPNYCTKARSVLSQKYSGDITIFPEIPFSHFPRVLSNPDTEFMQQAMLGGERATWPKLSRVKNHCAIELALDEAVRQLRARIAFSPSQIDLRQNVRTSTRPLSQGFEYQLRGRALHLEQLTQRNSGSLKKIKIDSGGSANVPQLSQPVPRNSFQHSHHSPNNPLSPESVKISSSEALSSSTSVNDTSDIDADESDSFSSSAESPTSAGPQLWPSTRQLFPSASQPTTPSIASRSFGSLSMTTTTPVVTTTRPPRSPGPNDVTYSFSGPGLNVTPSSPERRYKRLFHESQNPNFSTIPTVNEPEPPSLHRRSDSITRSRRESTAGLDSRPLELDISGTRGMLLRRKKTSAELNNIQSALSIL